MIKGNVFSEFNRDTGQISQSSKVYDHEGYDRLLLDRGIDFVQDNSQRYANLDLHWVRKVEGQWRRAHRDVLPIQIDRPRIKAGGNQRVWISGVPKGCDLMVTASLAGQQIVLTPRQPFDGPGLSLPAPTPGLYTITIRKWPYRDWVQQYEGLEG